VAGKDGNLISHEQAVSDLRVLMYNKPEGEFM